MKTIIRIARLELKTLFYSPVAWLVLIVFFAQSGYAFLDTLNTYKTFQSMGGALYGVTSGIFTGPFGYFGGVQGNIYLYIPLLTMGLIAREVSSGSIKLLQTSPVRVHQMVLGKYLGMIVYCAMMMFVLLLVTAVAHHTIVAAQVRMILSGILGIYLLACTYSAIGLFLSSVTSYQIIAAFGTFAVLAALNFIGALWQDVDLVRHITYFLSLRGRADGFIIGLISTSDLFYFLIVIVLFLGLTVFRLQSQQESKPFRVSARRYALLLGVLFLAGYISSRFSLTGYLDVTTNHSRTLTAYSQQIVKAIKHPLRSHTYVNLLDSYNAGLGLPGAVNSDHRFYEPYQRFLPDEIKVDYTYYYDSVENDPMLGQNPNLTPKEVAENVADGVGMSFDRVLDPAAMRKIGDMKPWYRMMARRLVAGNDSTVIGMFAQLEGANPLEKEMIPALRLLNVPAAKLVFLTGHNERSYLRVSDRDYHDRFYDHPDFRAIDNQGFSLGELNLDTADHIPTDISALVIADPTLPLKPAELEKINTYLAAGGNALIAGDPPHQGLINPLTAPLGVRLMDGLLLRQSKDFAPDYIISHFAPGAGGYSKQLHDLVADPAQQVTSTAGTALEYTATGPYTIEPFIISDSSNTWLRPGSVNMDSGKVSYDPGKGDLRKTLPLAVTLRRQLGGKEQRIIVFGDADFFANGQFSGVPKKNMELTLESGRWFAYGNWPIDIDRLPPADNTIQLSDRLLYWLRIFFLGVFPGLLLLGGAVLLYIRKSR